jgi:hypothetical protein
MTLKVNTNTLQAARQCEGVDQRVQDDVNKT